MRPPTSITRIQLIVATLASLALPTVPPLAAQEKLTLKATPKTVARGYYDAKTPRPAEVINEKANLWTAANSLLCLQYSGVSQHYSRQGRTA